MYEKGQQMLRWGREEKESEKCEGNRLKDGSQAPY